MGTLRRRRLLRLLLRRTTEVTSSFLLSISSAGVGRKVQDVPKGVKRRRVIFPVWVSNESSVCTKITPTLPVADQRINNINVLPLHQSTRVFQSNCRSRLTDTQGKRIFGIYEIFGPYDSFKLCLRQLLSEVSMGWVMRERKRLGRWLTNFFSYQGAHTCKLWVCPTTFRGSAWS